MPKYVINGVYYNEVDYRMAIKALEKRYKWSEFRFEVRRDKGEWCYCRPFAVETRELKKKKLKEEIDILELEKKSYFESANTEIKELPELKLLNSKAQEAEIEIIKLREVLKLYKTSILTKKRELKKNYKFEKEKNLRKLKLKYANL